jgi:hypothetical protein
MNIRPARSLVTFGAAAVLLFARSSDANAPSDHYQVNYYYEDANTVTDLKSGLTWKLALGSSLTWAQAKTYCQESGLHWRLPTEKELLSLVDLSKSSGPTIDTTYFGTGTLRRLRSRAIRRTHGESTSAPPPWIRSTSPRPRAFGASRAPRRWCRGRAPGGSRGELRGFG